MSDAEVNVYFIVDAPGTGPDEAEPDEAEADDAVVGATNSGVDNSICTCSFADDAAVSKLSSNLAIFL